MSNTVKLNTCPKCSAPIPAEAPQGLCPKCVLLGAATATEQGVPATATSEIPSLERIATAFPQLEILELIGRGGMGFVFKARQPHLDRFVALKLLPDKLAKDAQFAERFNREGRVLARLNHPNITSVFDFGHASAGSSVGAPISKSASGRAEDVRADLEIGAPAAQPETRNPKLGTNEGGFYYLLMEYVDGVNLRQAMKAGRFSPAEALTLVPKVCEALQYAHEQGVLHRDIKPENILLDAKGRVKIADFGIAKLVGEDQPNVTLTNTGAALGTPHYMAPEQLEKPSTVDHRADIYSLGVVFYEMLTGELPIGRFAAPSSKTPVNASVDDVVFRTLEKDPGRRFQSAGEMKTEVEHLGAGASTPPSVEVVQPLPAPAWMKRLGILFCVLGGVAFLATLLSLGSNVRVYHSGMLLAITGVALLTRDRWWSGAAIVVNVIGLVIPLVSMMTVKVMSRHGTLPPEWSLGIPGVPDSAGAGVLLSLAQAGAFAIGLWALLRPAAKACFLAKPYVPMHRAYTLWIFIGVLIVGLGAVLATRRNRASVAEAAAVAKENAIAAAPMIQFTFTSVELREETGARWLAMDYVEQVRGDCQNTFRYDARVPGFTAQTRKDSRLSDAKAGFAPVRHQRILWKLPDSLPQGDALALRDLVAKEWIGKSAAIEPGDERVLFKTLIPDGGTLAAAVGVRLKDSGSGTPPKTSIGSAKLIGARDYMNFAIARLESVPGHPLHQLIARFAGPEIPQTSRVATMLGPILVPSPDEDMNMPAEPVDGGILFGTNRGPVASAISFECPGDCSLQFVLPDENLARDAYRQMNQALAQPLSLVPGRQVQLFATGNWKGWLETRPFKPEPNRLAFFRHPGRSPAQIPGTNSIESAVATIPPGHELKVTGRLAVNGVSQPEPVFSTKLTSGPNESGIYWFTWYLLPNPQRMDMEPKENWELQIHDAVGRELLRSQAPEGLNILWRKKWVGDEPISVRTGKQIREIFFEKVHAAGDRSPTFVLLEMTMQRSVPVSPNQ